MNTAQLKSINPTIKYSLLLVARLWDFFKKNIPSELPNNLNGYQLVKNLKHDLNTTCKTGLYRTKTGRMVICKVWIGKRKDLNYLRLHQEIINHQILTRVVSRTRHLVPSHLKAVSLPRCLGYIQSPNSLCLLMEYINGTPIDQALGVKEQYDRLNQAAEYFQFLGTCLTGEEKSKLSKWSIQNDLPLYPFVLGLASIKRPLLALDLLRGFIKVLAGVPSLLNSTDSALIHGDLHPHNLLVLRGRVVILDLEEIVITYPSLELVRTVLCPLLTNSLRKKLLRLSESHRSFSPLLLNCSIHFLTSDLLTPKLDLCIRTIKNKLI